MSEQKGIRKGHIVAGGLGFVSGVVGTLLFTKWLPEYQERVARKQGAIMAEEFAKKTGQYSQAQGAKDPVDIYSLQNALNTINARLDELEERLRDYKGASQ
jgi:predicted  nucleic acid-binding Zn-ribbon protein